MALSSMRSLYFSHRQHLEDTTSTSSKVFFPVLSETQEILLIYLKNTKMHSSVSKRQSNKDKNNEKNKKSQSSWQEQAKCVTKKNPEWNKPYQI